MSGTRKRRGTTLVELSLVIAILAMIALPFAAFVSQNLKNTVQSSTQLKEQMVLEQVMQDMEKHLRSAISINGTTACLIDVSTAGKIVFTSRDPQALIGTVPTPTQYTYMLASRLLTKNGITFPDGLEASLITKLKFWSTTTEPPDAATPEPPDAATPSCYITVLIEAHDTSLQRTIYLRNYTSIVNIARILGVTAPAAGAPPVMAIAETVEYGGAVTWSPVANPFAGSTVYTATITLTPTAGFTLTGVAANFFTVAGATTVTNPVNSGVVTVVFPSTAATVITIKAIPGVTPPVKGATPVTTITATAQYTGTVVWTPTLIGQEKFKNKTVYTATITVIPNPGYTLTGVAANFFTVAGTTVPATNVANSGVVTAVFPATVP